MGKFRDNIRKFVFVLPFGNELIRMIRKFREDVPTFDGWGLKTYHRTPPWVTTEDVIGKQFSIVNESIIESVRKGSLSLSQFSSVSDIEQLLIELSWRHFILYWSVHHVLKTVEFSGENNFVECGVCDGLTITYALKAMDSFGEKNCAVYLYDAWQAMESDLLKDSEAKNIGAYSYLSMDLTKKNLEPYVSRTNFCQGFIPDSFGVCDNPSKIVWLHIDLNASIATRCALDFFYSRLLPGGCIVFDDYGSNNYRDTKLVVDQFFSDKKGGVLPLPTGQAIFFKIADC